MNGDPRDELQGVLSVAEGGKGFGCHVFTVRVSGEHMEWAPTTYALALKDGEHALYTARQPDKPSGELSDEEISAVGFSSGIWTLTRYLDDDQWNNIVPRLFAFARAAIAADRAAVSARPAVQRVPDGDWLWCELMAWCKKRGYHPKDMDDLFGIVGRARLAAAPEPRHECGPHTRGDEPRCYRESRDEN